MLSRSWHFAKISRACRHQVKTLSARFMHGNAPPRPPMQLQVDSRESDPHVLWEKYLSRERIVLPVAEPIVDPNSEIRPDAVRFVCISDTHERLGDIADSLPAGDVLLHCGDFTNFGDEAAIKLFNDQLAGLSFTHKIVIAGNHELGFEDGEDLSLRGERYAGRGTPGGYRLLTNCIWLQQSGVELYGGIKVYGTSFHSLPGYSFSRERGRQLLDCWNKIPAGVDVLLTHCPPLGHSDLYAGRHDGCAELLTTVYDRVKPRFHVFGHVHECHGVTSNGTTTFINAAICNNDLKCIEQPVVFDIPLPEGASKTSQSAKRLS